MDDFPRPPFAPQQQPIPGATDAMNPRPDHGESSYKGSGRLRDKKVLITGGIPALVAPSRSPSRARAPIRSSRISMNTRTPREHDDWSRKPADFFPNRRQRDLRLELRTVPLPNIAHVSPSAVRPLQGKTLS